jgi:putative transcription factor
LCGRQAEERGIVTIENVELRVCPKCAEGRNITKEVSSTRKFMSRPSRSLEVGDEVVEDYGTRIRVAREHMKIPVKVLAEMISEKEGVISRVEQQKMVPPDALRKKLEHALKIKLVDSSPTESSTYKAPGKLEEATLGDFIK